MRREDFIFSRDRKDGSDGIVSRETHLIGNSDDRLFVMVHCQCIMNSLMIICYRSADAVFRADASTHLKTKNAKPQHFNDKIFIFTPRWKHLMSTNHKIHIPRFVAELKSIHLKEHGYIFFEKRIFMLM